jgi:hypothetical protein
MDKDKERMANKALNVVHYLALARVIDNKKGAKVLIDAATETLSELVDDKCIAEDLIPAEEEIDIDLDADEDEDEDPTLELEDLEDDTALGEAEDKEDEEDEDESDTPVEDDDDEDDIVEIDDDDDDDEDVEDDEDAEEKPSESEAKVTRRALAIVNRLYSSGDEELKKVAGILAQKISEKKG